MIPDLPHVQLPCTPNEQIQAGDESESLESLAFCLDFRCPEDTELGLTIPLVSELFCRGHMEKVGEWLCKIYGSALWLYTMTQFLWFL